MSQVNQFLMSYGGLILFLIEFVEQSGVPLPAGRLQLFQLANSQAHPLQARTCAQNCQMTGETTVLLFQVSTAPP